MNENIPPKEEGSPKKEEWQERFEELEKKIKGTAPKSDPESEVKEEEVDMSKLPTAERSKKLEEQANNIKVQSDTLKYNTNISKLKDLSNKSEELGFSAGSGATGAKVDDSTQVSSDPNMQMDKSKAEEVAEGGTNPIVAPMDDEGTISTITNPKKPEMPDLANTFKNVEEGEADSGTFDKSDGLGNKVNPTILEGINGVGQSGAGSYLSNMNKAPGAFNIPGSALDKPLDPMNPVGAANPFQQNLAKLQSDINANNTGSFSGANLNPNLKALSNDNTIPGQDSGKDSVLDPNKGLDIYKGGSIERIKESSLGAAAGLAGGGAAAFMALNHLLRPRDGEGTVMGRMFLPGSEGRIPIPAYRPSMLKRLGRAISGIASGVGSKARGLMTESPERKAFKAESNAMGDAVGGGEKAVLNNLLGNYTLKDIASGNLQDVGKKSIKASKKLKAFTEASTANEISRLGNLFATGQINNAVPIGNVVSLNVQGKDQPIVVSKKVIKGITKHFKNDPAVKHLL